LRFVIKQRIAVRPDFAVPHAHTNDVVNVVIVHLMKLLIVSPLISQIQNVDAKYRDGAKVNITANLCSHQMMAMVVRERYNLVI